ncbi:MAG: hypothetical protein HZA36_02175 [Parcubacteria group bacterium]|nr:hypothetical protein [Parcubacteria group bacterium]
MFTFARRKEGETGVYCNGELVTTLPYEEDSVSFVAEDEDLLCLNAGIQSISTDFRTALDMIEDVIRGWSSNSKEQKKLYKADKEVAML